MPSNVDARTSDASASAPPARRLGKYRIEKQLGAGGMGTVFLAVDTELRRTVALKVLPRERAANPQLVRRFKSEGAAAARLEHENIVRVFDSGEIDGYLYLALEFVDGIDVQELVSKRTWLPVRRSIEIVIQVATALQHAYERGIVHRDIKPSNLLIRKDGVVKLTDMGLARAIDESVEAGITHAGMTVGTVDYISPEQGADSKQADIRSDLYSLGCSWYHMLTGEVPYPDGTAQDKLRAHNVTPIPDPRRINDRVPGAVVAVLQRLMAKRPENRYQSPQELVDDLRQPSLLHRETGAADIAGLAESASEMPTLQGASATVESPEHVLDDEHPDADGPRSQPTPGKRKVKRARSTAADTTRAGRANSAARDQGSVRDLPKRSERPDKLAVDHGAIDPQQLKLAGIGLLGLIVLACIGWAAWQYVQNSGDEPTPAGVNPFAPAPAVETSPAPPPVVSSAPKTQQRPEPPPPRISDFHPAAPFPGVADAASDPSVTDVPRWVYAAREHVLPQPHVVTVDSDSAVGAITADDALRQLPASGGVVEFKGRGPHPVPSLAVTGGRDVILRAADGDTPVLFWEDFEAQSGANITAGGGRLELDGLHIVASGRGRDASQPLITVENATLVIRNCSITLADPAAASIPAVHLARSTAGPSRCVLENVIVRGNNITAAALEGPGHELVIGNCFFATGSAPAVVVMEPAAGSLDGERAAASVQLLASAVVSQNSVFACEQRSDTAPPSLMLRTRHSVLIGDGPAATALRFEAWPEAPTAELDQPRLLGVDLVAERTSWHGWAHLTMFQNAAGGAPILVASEPQWLQFWRSPLAGAEHAAPDAASPLTDYQTADASAVLGGSTASAAAQPTSVARLDVAALPTIPATLVARLVADSARPRTPDDPDAAFAGQVVTFDLMKDGLKLNDRLNGPECPDGARVILKSTKQRAVIEPVSLSGKSLRIEFDSGGEPLVVEPVKLSGVERPAALFHVEHGRIDLVNANLRIPPSERTSYPLRLLQVVDGSFAVRNCLLYGQSGAASQDVPTIEWTPGNADPAQFALIENSLVTGQSQVVGGLLHGQLLEVRNSIIVSSGDCFRLEAASAEQRSTLHVASSTLSAAAACFRISAPSAPETPAGRLQVFVEQTVYGQPVAESQGPVLLVQASRGDQAPQVDWWEHHTAVSDRITRFRIADDVRTSPQDLGETWLRGWGPDHVSNVVSGPLSVLVVAKDIEPSKSQPDEWQLDDKSLAATAASDGGPLGAETSAVGPGKSAVGARKTGKGAAPRQDAPPRGRTRPAF